MTTPTNPYLHADSPEEQVCFASVEDVARGLAEGHYSARELTEVFLRRIERLNPDLGAYVAVLGDEALRAAGESDRRRQAGQSLGFLDGIPLSVKDLAPVKDAPFTAGLRPLKNQLAGVDATHVRRFREAGAVILGLTNTSEMGHKATTDNMLFGPTRNPHDLA
jgi:Asp-tRNA(Asn)/Glu-tRNA(Gln) amidotransferase A subunit family amidase